MTMRSASGSGAEDLFIRLFEDTFGAEKTGCLYSQYPFYDIYQDSRFADFLLENGGRRVAIEVDDDASHLPGHVSERNEMTERFASGKIRVICACNLLNEGWDCPETEVLFMARPTMSRVLYTQRLGRGMRLAEGKESLIVFDFVDNAGLPVEKPNSVYCREDATDSEIQRNILSNPFRRFEDMQMTDGGEKSG